MRACVALSAAACDTPPPPQGGGRDRCLSPQRGSRTEVRERLAVAVRAQCLRRAGPNGEAEAPAVCGQHPEAGAEAEWGGRCW